MRGEAKRFSKYSIIGLVNNAGLYVLFVGLIYVSVSPVMAAGICYVLGVAIAYLLNRRWAFESSNSHMRDLPRVLAAYGVGLLSTLVTIALLVRWMPAEIAQILNVLITAVVIYTMLRILRFGAGENGHVH